MSPLPGQTGSHASHGTMFDLVKWYFDVVADDGTAFIGYAARLRRGRLRLRYASALLAPPGLPVRESASVRKVEPPTRSGRSLAWRSNALDVEGQWLATTPAIREMLHTGDDGVIDWFCTAPSARAQVSVGTQRIEGRGYVECIRVTVPPASLPFCGLQWGRFISAGHALVWIAWDGGQRLRRVWVDGQARHDACVSVSGLAWPGGRPDLSLEDQRVLRERCVPDALAGLVPSWVRRLPGPLSGMRETKWLSRGTLRDEAGGTESGWAIHEVVTWAGPAGQ